MMRRIAMALLWHRKCGSSNTWHKQQVPQSLEKCVCDHQLLLTWINHLSWPHDSLFHFHSTLDEKPHHSEGDGPRNDSGAKPHPNSTMTHGNAPSNDNQHFLLPGWTQCKAQSFLKFPILPWHTHMHCGEVQTQIGSQCKSLMHQSTSQCHDPTWKWEPNNFVHLNVPTPDIKQNECQCNKGHPMCTACTTSPDAFHKTASMNSLFGVEKSRSVMFIDTIDNFAVEVSSANLLVWLQKTHTQTKLTTFLPFQMTKVISMFTRGSDSPEHVNITPNMSTMTTQQWLHCSTLWLDFLLSLHLSVFDAKLNQFSDFLTLPWGQKSVQCSSSLPPVPVVLWSWLLLSLKLWLLCDCHCQLHCNSCLCPLCHLLSIVVINQMCSWQIQMWHCTVVSPCENDKPPDTKPLNTGTWCWTKRDCLPIAVYPLFPNCMFQFTISQTMSDTDSLKLIETNFHEVSFWKAPTFLNKTVLAHTCLPHFSNSSPISPNLHQISCQLVC